MTGYERLVIIGLDGATWTVLDPMRERGLTPNLDALLRRSAYGTLRSTIPPVTSAAWTTMMTGCGPTRHGVFDHRYFDIGAGRMKVNHSARVKVSTFWHELDRAGRSMISLNVPVTYPPLDVRGIIVSGMDSPHLEAALSGAPEFGARLRDEIPAYGLKTIWKRPPADVAEMTDNARLTIELAQARSEAAEMAAGMCPDWSALMVQFQTLDPFQHRAWRFLNVDETGIDDPDMNALAGEVVRGFDSAVGRLCELADRANAGVLVVSDHGFGPCLGRVQANRILIDAGIAKIPGSIGKLAGRVGRTIDRVKSWSVKRGNPEMRAAWLEHSIQSQFPFDWKRTLAFAPHQDTAAMVYLNSSSRRAGAPIRTPRQADDALQGTIRAFREALHPETGVPLFPQVIPVAETYGVDPAREGYPDVIAMPDENYWVRTKLGSSKRWVEPDANLPGTHRPEGIVIFSGPDVTPGRNLKANLQDIAPTILKWFRLPIPSHVEGKPLPGLPDAPEGERLDAPSAAVSGPHRPQFDYSAEEQAVIEQRLADLGYLE